MQPFLMVNHDMLHDVVIELFCVRLLTKPQNILYSLAFILTWHANDMPNYFRMTGTNYF